MKKTYLTLCVFLLTATFGNAQQFLSFSQFSFNKGEFNPAYTGYKETWNAALVHRSQWVGFKGAPSSQTLLMEAPIRNTKIAIGGRLVHDKIGPTSEIILAGDIAYRLRLRDRKTLSFGLKLLGSYHQSNITDLALISDYYGEVDSQFELNPENTFAPNVGFGVYYYSKKFYVGLSSPRMLRTELNKNQYSNITNLGKTAQVYYFMTGYTWKINRTLEFLPNLTVLATENSPLSIGTYMNFIFMKEFSLIFNYHYLESTGVAFQWKLDKKWNIGYSLDFAANALIKTNYGSHEINLGYVIRAKTNRIVYPRYF